MASSGLIIDDLYWSGNPVLPAAVQQSITNKIAATQMAEQRQNEVAQQKPKPKSFVHKQRVKPMRGCWQPKPKQRRFRSRAMRCARISSWST
ncbi:hypothetical protein [Xanthomonas phage JGB6]|nr:hypothetical protein [Xanthomonas phage JGB6]